MLFLSITVVSVACARPLQFDLLPEESMRVDGTEIKEVVRIGSEIGARIEAIVFVGTPKTGPIKLVAHRYGAIASEVDALRKGCGEQPEFVSGDLIGVKTEDRYMRDYIGLEANSFNSFHLYGPKRLCSVDYQWSDSDLFLVCGVREGAFRCIRERSWRNRFIQYSVSMQAGPVRSSIDAEVDQYLDTIVLKR